MNVGQTVNKMKGDLTKIVQLCNEAEDYRLANVAQSCLQAIGNLSTTIGEGDSPMAKTELKSGP